MDLTPDQTDAILRDPNAPGSVRAAVLSDYEVTRYLGTVEFYEDNDGVTHTRAAADPGSEPAPATQDPTPSPATAPPVAAVPDPAPVEPVTPTPVEPTPDTDPDNDNDDTPPVSA